jgi:hypothetical protein
VYAVNGFSFVYAVNGFSNSYATVIVIITKRLKILSTLICLSKSQQMVDCIMEHPQISAQPDFVHGK